MIKLPKIKFIKSNINISCGTKREKAFRLFFHTAEIPTEPYTACFCHQSYDDDVDLVIGKKEKIHLGKIEAPMIIVTKQGNLFKTLKSFLHEFGHYIIWFFTYWNKRNKVYDCLEEIYEFFFQTKELFIKEEEEN